MFRSLLMGAAFSVGLHAPLVHAQDAQVPEFAPAQPQAPAQIPGQYSPSQLPAWVRERRAQLGIQETGPSAPEAPARPEPPTAPTRPDWVTQRPQPPAARVPATESPATPVTRGVPAAPQPPEPPRVRDFDVAPPAAPAAPELPAWVKQNPPPVTGTVAADAPQATGESEVAAEPTPQPVVVRTPVYRQWRGAPHGAWIPPHGGWNRGWSPWGSGWGNNNWWPWGSGWGGNDWWPWGGGWGNNGWNNSYGTGHGDGWGNTWGDGTGDAAGDMDFSFALRGRANADMRGHGYGDGYGYGRGYGRGYDGYYPYPPPLAPMPVPQPTVEEEPAGPPDADEDGVSDASDLCPSTAEGARVDALGCAETARIVLRGVNFKTDSDELTPESLTILDGVSATLSANPDIRVMVGGHTDSDGEDAYNKDLSQRRAQSVVDYLAGQGVDRNNMIARGFGEEQPVADNDSAEGKAQNRRVELNRL